MSTKMLEDTLAKRGLPVDQSAKQAITQGAQAVKDEAKAILNSTESATARAQKSENKAVYDY